MRIGEAARSDSKDNFLIKVVIVGFVIKCLSIIHRKLCKYKYELCDII